MIDTKVNELLRNYSAKVVRWVIENWQDSPNDIRIGIWGTSGTGKTTFLTMLYYTLTDTVCSKKWIVSVDKEGRRFFQENFKHIEEDREFPPSTEVVPEYEIFRYTLTPRSHPNAYKIVLNFIDAPGGFYEDVYRANSKIIDKKIPSSHELEDDKKMNIIDYLMSCDGIVFLLDPERRNKDGDSYSSLLRDLFLEFQQRYQQMGTSDPRLEQYMAFCVTKVDREEYWNQRREPQKLAEQVMGKRMSVSHLQTYCRLEPDLERRKQRSKNNRCEFFCVSSIGRYLENGEWKCAVEYPDENNSQTLDNQRNEPYKDNISPVYDPKKFDPEYRTTTPSSSSSISWILSSQPEDSDLDKRRKATILDVEFQPYQVIDPIEWLIEGIRANPPLRSHQR